MGRGEWSQRSSWREQAVTQTMLAPSTEPGLPREQGAQPTGKTDTCRDCVESFSLKALFLFSKQAVIQL